MSDQEVAHMMIAVLMAGQHTSSATGTWMGLYLADHKDIVYIFLFIYFIMIFFF